MVDVTLYDHRGQPIKRSNITDGPQTARIGQLYKEFATHPVRGLTPGKLARILENAEHGDLQGQCDLFEDMEEKDGHISADLGKRKRAILGLDWSIVAPRNASKVEENAASLLQEIITDIPNFDDVLFNMADAIGYGYSNLEYDWMQDGKEWIQKTIEHRPPGWFTVSADDRNELRLRNNTADGESLQPFGWISHIHKAKSGYVTRAGLHRVLAWPFLFKNYSVRDLAEFLEIYGLPIRLGEYPPGASDTEKATLLRAVVNIGHAAAGIIPQGMAIDFKEAAKGASDPYQAMIDWCERTQSKAILGGTLTSQADGKSSTNALGNVHNDVRHDLLVSDARQIASTLTRDLVYPLGVLNTSAVDSVRRCPRFRFYTDEDADLNQQAERDTKIYNMGYAPTEEYIQTTYGEGWVKRETKPTQAALKGQVTAALKVGETQDVADQYLDQLETKTTAAMTTLLEPVRRLVIQADSLEAIRDGLLDMYPDMDASTFSETLQQALAAAELAGRYEVHEDTDA